MSQHLPPTAGNIAEWIRKAALAVNNLLRGLMPTGEGEPPDPSPGQVYFDSTLGKLRCWDGTTWNDLF